MSWEVTPQGERQNQVPVHLTEKRANIKGTSYYNSNVSWTGELFGKLKNKEKQGRDVREGGVEVGEEIKQEEEAWS